MQNTLQRFSHLGTLTYNLKVAVAIMKVSSSQPESALGLSHFACLFSEDTTIQLLDYNQPLFLLLSSLSHHHQSTYCPSTLISRILVKKSNI